jgi:hypothetical protein
MDSSQSNLQMNNNSGVADSPLLLFQPFNVVVFLSFFSPIILAIIMICVSFLFQNFKGFIYLGFLIAACIIRNFIYTYTGASPLVFNNTICTSIQYTKYGNSSFSIFVFAFTIMYIFLPMFVNGGENYAMLSFMLFYAFLDIFIKVYKKCIITISDVFVNLLSGLALAALIVSAMYFGGSGKYLFFNEIASNKEICLMPSKQTFKCSVYRNGTLVSNL